MKKTSSSPTRRKILSPSTVAKAISRSDRTKLNSALQKYRLNVVVSPSTTARPKSRPNLLSFRNCSADFLTYDGNNYLGIPCDVRFEGDKLVVSWFESDDPVIYEGIQGRPGSYILKSPAVQGTATLHRQGDIFLEGSWRQHNGEFFESGLWRIELSKPMYPTITS